MRRALWILAMAPAACTGGLGHRSVARMAGELPLDQGVRAVRIEIENGTVEVRPGAAGLRYVGVVKRAADSAAELARFEARGDRLSLQPDEASPGTWVVRGPTRPPDASSGVLGVEVALTLPAHLPLEVRIRDRAHGGSGHVVVEDRTAPVTVDTQRGDVRVMRCSGAARVHSGRGNIIVYEHVGDVDVDVATGDMQVFVAEPGRRLRLVTGMGNVQCLVPPTTGFAVDARVEMGKIANGFGLPVERLGEKNRSAKMVGARGDGATEVVLHAGRGHLSLSHKVFRDGR
jgi:hypothetical protein